MSSFTPIFSAFTYTLTTALVSTGLSSVSYLSFGGNITTNPNVDSSWCFGKYPVSITAPVYTTKDCFSNYTEILNTATANETCNDMDKISYRLYLSDDSVIPNYMSFPTYNRKFSCTNSLLS
jgi:hypothetical protein